MHQAGGVYAQVHPRGKPHEHELHRTHCIDGVDGLVSRHRNAVCRPGAYPVAGIAQGHRLRYVLRVLGQGDVGEGNHLIIMTDVKGDRCGCVAAATGRPADREAWQERAVLIEQHKQRIDFVFRRANHAAARRQRGAGKVESHLHFILRHYVPALAGKGQKQQGCQNQSFHNQ